MTSPSLMPSLWIEASAGSGKTYQLIQRILTLLMEDSPFNEILCITFTNAAANEMEHRLMEKLEEWATCSEETLIQDLEKISSTTITKDHLLKARYLYEEYLWADQKINFTTLHGFCQYLLKIFALESGLSPNFKVLEDAEKETLWQDAFSTVSSSSASEKDLQELVPDTTLLGLQAALYTILNQRYAWVHLESLENGCLETLTHLSPNSQATNPSLIWQQLSDSYPLEAVRSFCEILKNGSSTDQAFGDTLFTLYPSFCTKPSATIWNALIALFTTQKGTLKKRLISKKLAETFPEKTENFLEFSDDLYETHQRLLALHIRKKTTRLLTFFKQVYQTYETLKTEKGALDFDDLIIKTHELLSHSEYGSWIRYKLDGRLTHILLDEAQDTSQLQWSMLMGLLDDFFAQNDGFWTKSLFVVGDAKQSIFSFQGADLSLLHAYESHIHAQFSLQNQSLEKRALSHSFRSTEPILTFVDTLFNHSAFHKSAVFNQLSHTFHRENEGGQVILWPLTQEKESESNDDFGTPAPKELAKKIATTIKTWLTENRFLMGVNRPISPRDIMILVQRRGSFTSYMAQALLEQDVPFAGLDRLFLQENLAVKDLHALCKFLLLPEDDFSLACILRSPLFELDEEVFHELCLSRKESSLWSHLRNQSSENSHLQEIEHSLLSLLNQVDYQPPSTLIASILFEQKGLDKWVHALGPNTSEPLLEYLTLCELTEREKGPSLELWVHWFETQETVLKRSLQDKSQDYVRLMTVHASKGLQAPIVFLPDTTETKTVRGPLYWKENGFAWASGSEAILPGIQSLKSQAQQDQDQEAERLLYVALTRAEEQLYLCGWEPTRGELSATCWYHQFKQTLISLEATETPSGLLYEKQALHKKEASPSTAPIKTPPLPKWIDQPYEKSAPITIIRPSDSGSEKEPDSKNFEALAYGTLMHKLLEFYPSPQTKEIYLEKATLYVHALDTPFLSSEKKEKALTDLQKTLASEAGKLLSQKELYAEASFLFQEKLSVVRGQIDVILKDEKAKILWIIDYKTGQRKQPAPKKYQTQLAAYAAMLSELYPDYKIHTALLWIEDACYEEV